MNHEREQIVKTADRLRDELLVTLRELERRRESAFDVPAQLRRHRSLLTWIGSGLGVALAGTAAYLVLHARHRRRVLPQRRWEGLVRAWQHPDRLASRAPHAPVHLELARKAALAFLTALVAASARRAAAGLLPTDTRRRATT